MTFARPHRLLTAAALVAALALPAAAYADGGHGHHGLNQGWPGRHGHHRTGPGPEVRPHTITGTLTALSGATTPATLTVQTVGGLSIDVTVPATATVVRRYDGPSGLGKMTVGDRVSVWGSFESGSNTFDAVRLRDWTIQRADSQVIGTVDSVTTTNTTVVTIDVGHGHGRRDPYHHGETVQVSISASTIVMSGTVAVSTTVIQPSMRIAAVGVYDRAGRVLDASRVRILHARGENQPSDEGNAQTDTAPTGTPTELGDDASVATPTPTAGS